MADPLSITASLLAVITAAVQSTKALRETIIRFKGRDKTLARLQHELCDLVTILDSLKQVIGTEAEMLALLKGPIERCAQVCHDFEKCMQAFGSKSKTTIKDWTKMEFMRGDIHEFIDTISGYKSTISVGLGTLTIHNAKVSQKVLEDYNEMIKDTMCSLEVHLQRVDEKMGQLSIDNTTTSSSSLDLNDEKEVTKQCLRICENACHYIASLAGQESSLLQGSRDGGGKDHLFEAQRITRQALDKNQDSFDTIIRGLRARLEILVSNNDPGDENERTRLIKDIDASEQCLEICKVASEVSNRKEYRVGEVVADGESDQVVVNTLADLFDVKKALSLGNSAQLVGSMTEEALRHLTDKRYTSRFGALSYASSNTDDRVTGQIPARGDSAIRAILPKYEQARAGANEVYTKAEPVFQ
ncbi:hypothetical protein N7468_004161 [Penicillium chermesinum]|uniref:Azaphilone pigments biosynthesis cluster protein L N-terminal domain-containing protein n=1 Tax=Penicillium chermesinum TaxID=63820 RepID=A0A9W9TSH5_9EURO|nr:uncharacterized protein N7468_004161 [Penicillium chermesinum]KAJ5239542.1 hypothetical protein N7468_004161 [Penicillium chermesinum]